ncbi:MAG: cupin domain-containing protein, partial [Methanothrix sp.]|nr:cupin domain-containing protein [Methanothrix sp.]
MIIRDLAKCRYFRAMDNTLIGELLHPEREGLDLPYSIAHAILQPGATSLPHRLKTSTEVYFILEGEGEMHIDTELSLVRAGQAVLIPPGSWQYIQNTGDVILKFICLVSPPWRSEDEEIEMHLQNSDEFLRKEVARVREER